MACGCPSRRKIQVDGACTAFHEDALQPLKLLGWLFSSRRASCLTFRLISHRFFLSTWIEAKNARSNTYCSCYAQRTKVSRPHTTRWGMRVGLSAVVSSKRNPELNKLVTCRLAMK